LFGYTLRQFANYCKNQRLLAESYSYFPVGQRQQKNRAIPKDSPVLEVNWLRTQPFPNQQA